MSPKSFLMQVAPADHPDDEVGPSVQHNFRSQRKAEIKAAKGKGKGSGKKSKKGEASGSSKSPENDPEIKPRPAVAKPKVKATAKAKAKAKASKECATPAKKPRGRQPFSPRMNAAGEPLGCPTCRWAPRGCLICRKPGYKPRSVRPNGK